MVKFTVSMMLAASLAACGGGTSDATPAAVAAPVMAANQFVTNANATMTMTGNDREVAVKTTIRSNLWIKGNNNKAWITDNQAFGTLTLDGAGNTVIFRPGATADALIANGANSSIYLPVGATMAVTGAAAATTSIHYYIQ